MASIVITPGSVPYKLDCSLGQTITLTSGTVGGTYAWSVLAAPSGSAATLATPSASSTTFVPDVRGSYRIQLVVDGNVAAPAVTILAVPQANIGPIRQPAQGEEAEGGGWDPPVNALIRLVDDIVGNPNNGITFDGSHHIGVNASGTWFGFSGGALTFLGLSSDGEHGNRGGGSLHSLVIAGGAAGFMSGADKTSLNTLVAKNASSYSLMTEALTVNASPLTISAYMGGKTAGGSVAGAGATGVVSGSFASSGAETGTGAGQAGLGSAAASGQPYNSSDFPGQHRITARLTKLDGSDILVSDLLSSPGSDGPERVYGYVSYRSDLTAWRLWLYYRTSATGFETPLTPDQSVSNAKLYVPEVFLSTNLPVGAGLGVAVAGESAAAVVPGNLGDITNVNATTTLAGSTGRFADAGHQHQHGSLTGGSLHALVVAAGAAGFMSGADKTKLDSMTSGAAVASVAASAPLASSGGTTPTISLSIGTGLVNSAGSLAADFGTGAGKVTQGNDSRLPPTPSQVGNLIYDTGSAYATVARGAANTVLLGQGAGSPSFGQVPNAALANNSVTINSGTGLSGGGTLALGASLTLTVDQTFSPTWSGNHIFSSYIDINAISSPANPASGVARLYSLTANNHTWLVFRDDDGAEFNVTRDNIALVRNTSGGTLTKGTVVYVSGATGNVPQIGKAKADSTMANLPALGLVLIDIANNSYGYVLCRGVLSSFNTSAFSAGDTLYVDPTTAGNLTNTAPSHPQVEQAIGTVTVSGVGNGSIYVNCSPTNLHRIDGTNRSSFAIGDATAGAKTLLFKNGQTGTLSWNPTGSRTITIPDTTDTLVVQARQIATGSGLQGGGDLSADRTLSIATGGVTNSMLANDSITISTANGITGGVVALGASLSLSGTLSGDVTGGLTATTVGKINGVTLGSTTATAGNLLIGSGTQWVSTAISGDATLTSGGVLTVGAGAITNSKLANNSITISTANGITGGTVALGSSLSLSGTLSGDVTGALTATSVGKIQGKTVDTTSPTDGTLLIGRSSDSSWRVASVGTSGGITATAGGGSLTIGISPATGSSAGSMSASDKAKIDTLAAGLGVYGNGDDGAAAFDGVGAVTGASGPVGNVYTLTRDVFYSSATISTGVTVKTMGYRVFCTGTFTLTGTGTLSAAGTNGGTPTAGSAPYSSTSGTLGSGGNGGSGSGTGAGSSGTSTNPSFSTGNAGNGGGGSSGGGGSGGTVTAPSVQNGHIKALPFATMGFLVGVGGGTPINGGAGGGGGGAGGTGSGGGGGGGGGVIMLAAMTITGGGTITVAGGNGGNGTAGQATGGGGGGCGGTVILVYRTISGFTGTVSVAGGSLGTKGAAGGSDGTAGSNGLRVDVVF